MIVTELMEGGDMEDLILNQKKVSLSLCKRMQMAQEAALGINWLHCSKPMVLHGDVKPSNFLLDKNLKVKVGDFNLSSLTNKNGEEEEQVEGQDKGNNTFLSLSPFLSHTSTYTYTHTFSVSQIHKEEESVLGHLFI
jgi:serine/threonine protein kinase